VRFVGSCYRAHDPSWAFKTLSGARVAIRGARFNPKGVPTLYLALTVMTAIKEANQGLAHRIDPCVLCSYDVDCEDIADLCTESGRRRYEVAYGDMACAWAAALSEGKRPVSWEIYERLRVLGSAGILVPSFASGAAADDRNLVLWDWGPDLPHNFKVSYRSGRLPKDQLSWR
jgi:RES domain-containing protein